MLPLRLESGACKCALSGGAIVNHADCEQFGKAILGHFGGVQPIGHSLGTFDKDWGNLETLVDKWWAAYQAWEAQDTLPDAFKEQRLTVKGTTTMDTLIEARRRPADPTQRYDGQAWGETEKFDTKIIKTNASILGRQDPKVFVPQGKGASRKTEMGYHDLSALLLNPNADISAQQYKGRAGQIDPEQVYVFMPLSEAIDQAVFQNINTLAKACRKERPTFYDTVRDIRSKMTRIKLLAEHDMATSFVMVGNREENGGPKFKYTLLSETDVSFRDEQTGVVPQGTFKNKLTQGRVLDAVNKADPPLEGIGIGDRARLANRLADELKPLLDKTFDPLQLQAHVEALFGDRKFQQRLKELKPPPSPEVLARCQELILGNAGGKTLQNYKTTPGIFEARQRAAINYHMLILGKMNSYAELTIAYRRHAGVGQHAFPKFAKFDKPSRLWTVGDVDGQNVWTARQPAERFPDRPV
jgi:hypothetical protein